MKHLYKARGVFIEMRNLDHNDGIYNDVYDGKEFQVYDGVQFLQAPNNLAIMVNIDHFNLYNTLLVKST